ncbi:HAD-IIB family hydrolase [Mycoplasma sp. 4404]|uniref:HAD-IIB family hydrolase n=1 Tax=Mycoplasma sp. 4404 TaxID=3108530 RepID=UPI002B1E6B41|nr:HAD-IIB family hydrolase [Mycoplasma sp. 4404]MEA4162763.1 HAD-IIB family hydrolase [Mycoplasma sp. 4404]
MQKPKIIFIDLDGTTLDGPEEKFWMRSATEFTKKTLTELNKQIPVVVATGRGLSAKTSDIVKGLTGEITYIAWNGAVTVENGKIISEEIIEPEKAQLLFDLISKNFAFVTIDSRHVYVKNYLYYIIKFVKKIYKNFSKKFRWISDAKPYKDFKNDYPIHKALLSSLSARKAAKFAKRWKEKYGDIFEIAFVGEKNKTLEITKIGSSKGEAEVAYCKLKGIDPKDAMHIGDSMNDSTTKGKVGTLIAMQNSVPELKKIADEITELPCNESGLAKYLSQFLDK